jgi:YegS/Rv2252/BmrU family lipid kinase
MRVYLIANPIAGGGSGAGAAERVAAVLRGRGHRVECHFTRGAGDAQRLAAAAGSTCDCLFVVGGDGTLNEVLNGLDDPSRLPLALLAVGTANMLARDLDLPSEPEAAALLVESQATRNVDLARIGEHRFFGNVGVGFDAQVVADIARRRAGTLGFRAYLAPIFRVLSRYREPLLEVRMDGGAPLLAGWVVVSNLSNYGGLFRFSPDARCDSGHLEVCVFARARRRELVRAAAVSRRGRLDAIPGVSYHTARRLVVTSGEPVPVQVDGDAWGTTPVEVEVEAQPVRVRVDPVEESCR